MLSYFIAAVVLAPVLALIVGALMGRVRVKSCCAPTDPSKDLRMRDAFTDEGDGPPSRRAAS